MCRKYRFCNALLSEWFTMVIYGPVVVARRPPRFHCEFSFAYIRFINTIFWRCLSTYFLDIQIKLASQRKRDYLTVWYVYVKIHCQLVAVCLWLIVWNAVWNMFNVACVSPNFHSIFSSTIHHHIVPLSVVFLTDIYQRYLSFTFQHFWWCQRLLFRWGKWMR